MEKNKAPATVAKRKVIHAGGYIFENARGGPYKYGVPLPATRANLRAVENGEL